ncbi:LCP family protein [Bifidobacterium platyrrhinorum]|nr:LCP family protein [Bifidobacterium platyrrhinorum]
MNRTTPRSTERHAAASPAEAAPASFSPAPARAARRSSGSGNVASRTPRTTALQGASPLTARNADAGSRATARSIPRASHGHHAPRIAATALAVIVAALAITVFGAWHWVDSRLNKESGWLTSAADTSASTWLILGSDERDGTAGGSADDTPGFRTDTILVLTKPKNGPSSLISIPRDSLVQVDDQYMKINAVAQLEGNQALVGTVEQITGQKIDHIAKIKFGGLQEVVDAIGGVNLCYDQTVSDVYSGLNWQAGCHVADGATALAFSRMRYSDANGDFGRAQRQRQVIAAIVSKASSKAVLSNPAKVMKVAAAGLAAVTVDDDTSPATLLTMALAFKDATGDGGVTGSVYWSDPDYQVDGVGSSVLLDDTRNVELFSELAGGTHKAGTVGSLAEAG